MSTINNKMIVDSLIRNNGYYEDDPRVVMIVEYTTKWGGIAYGVSWVTEDKVRQQRYTIESEFIINPKVIWSAYETTT